jgi:hypothetical protein
MPWLRMIVHFSEDVNYDLTWDTLLYQGRA